MAESNVRSIEALDDLRTALLRFDADAQEGLRLAEQQVQQTAVWLERAKTHWQREAQRWNEAAQQGLRDLIRCRATAYRDPKTGRTYVPDCSAHERAVAVATARMRDAEEEVANIARWGRAIAEVVVEYQRRAQRLRGLLGNDVPKAGESLGRMSAALRGYTSGGGFSGGAFGSSAPSISFSGMPAVGGTGTPPSNRTVELRRIDVSDSHVHGPNDFHKVSYDDMVEGFRKLQHVVRPAVEQGADGEYFSRLDAEQGLENAQGYRHIYESFYGDSAIRLDALGDRYIVVNGYHRLYVAGDLGIETVPAHIEGPVP